MQKMNILNLNLSRNRRNSTVEAARMIAIFGIIVMHSTGQVFHTVTSGMNCVLLIIINNFFNVGVTLFALISGYYAIRDKTKIITIHQKIVLYSIISFAGISLVTADYISAGKVIKMLFPVAGRKYWFATCYVFLLLLAPFLNCMIEKMEEKQLKELVLIIIFILSGISTVFFFFNDVMLDGGKGLAWIVLCYIVGGY